MRAKILVGLMAAILAVTPLASARELPAQEESGTVLFPTPHPQDPTICFQGIGRRINMATAGVVSGPFGEIFDIDKATWGGKFKLTTTSALSGSADLDIYFFADFGDPVDDPSMNSPIILNQYQKRNDKGEVGIVPPQSTKAIACLFEGFGASFDYKASPKKK